MFAAFKKYAAGTRGRRGEAGKEFRSKKYSMEGAGFARRDAG